MANTPTREHLETSLDLAEYLCAAFSERPWPEVRKRILEYLADAEQRGYESGREAERAEVTAYVYQELGDDADQLLIDINMGKHLAKEE